MGDNKDLSRSRPLFDRQDFDNAKDGFFPAFGEMLGRGAATVVITAICWAAYALVSGPSKVDGDAS